MRGVALVSPGGRYGGGGMGSVTRSMAEWFEKFYTGIYIVVIDPRGDGPRWQFPFHLVKASFQLVYVRIRHKVDILHLQISERGSFLRKGLLLVVGRALGMKIIVHHHGAELIPFFTSASRAVRWWACWVVRNADLNIVLGQRWKVFISQEMGVNPNRIAVLYNATGDTKTNSTSGGAPRLDLTARGDQYPVHLLLMANLSPRKGVSEFLQSLAQLKMGGLSFKATLAGGGDIIRYSAEAKALNITDLCTFTGWLQRGEVEDLLFSADALILPSYEEGLPIVILEALSASVPVVATRVGSIPEVLENEVTCLLVNPGQVGELVAALRRIVLEPELRHRLSQNGRRLYEAKFELNSYMHSILDRYRQLEAS